MDLFTMVSAGIKKSLERKVKVPEHIIAFLSQLLSPGKVYHTFFKYDNLAKESQSKSIAKV